MQRMIAAGLVAAALVTTEPGRAADTTPEQAVDLRHQLHAFIAGVIGPELRIPDDLLQIADEGDHFRIGWTSPDLPGVIGSPITFSVAVRRLDDGTWAIEDARFPNPILLQTPMPRTKGERGAGPGVPRSDEPGGGDVGIAINVGTRELHGLFDPGLTRTSTLQADTTGIDMEITGPDIRQQAQIGQQTTAFTMTPAADGTVDLRELISAQDVRVAQTSGRQPSLAYDSKTFRVTADIDHLAIQRLPLLLQAGLQLGAARADKTGHDDLDASERALLASGIAALRDLMTGLRVSEQLEGLHLVTAQGLKFDLDRMEFGLDSAAPGPEASIRTAIVLDGLRLPDAPPAIADYIPSHLELRPVATGIDLHGLTDLALASVAAGADATALNAQALALLQSSKLDVGLERIALDVGPARLAGHGTMRVRGPGDITGEAEIAITGFDALAAQLKRRPDTKQALPFIAMARKLAKVDGDRLVWRIAVDRNLNVLVNGTDLSQLTGKPL